MQIKTNNIPRLLKYGYEMPDNIRKDFDYIKDDFDSHEFFVYKGQWYDLEEFIRIGNNNALKGWHGYMADSFFSGILVKLVEEDSVIVGQYLC